MSLPEVTSREQWLEARRRLLAQEKELTHHHDALNASRRRLPMVKVERDYVFEGPAGPVTLAELFGDKRQLIVQHVMFGPGLGPALPGLLGRYRRARPGRARAHGNQGDSLRADLPRPLRQDRRGGQGAGLVRSRGTPASPATLTTTTRSSLDESRGQVEYNYRAEPGLLGGDRSSEMPGYSCFLRADGEIFHTYSAYTRGTEYLGNAYTFLDLTALGRQEDWEEPKGRVAPVRGGDPTFTS